MSLVWRWIVFGCVALGLAGAGHMAYQRFFREHVLVVAVAKAEGQDAALISAINQWLVEQGRRYRLRIVESGSEQASLDLLRQRKAHVASVRTDNVSGTGLAAMLMLYSEAAVLMAPENSVVSGWRDLNRRALGVTAGTSRSDPLLQMLLKANGVDDSLLVEVPAGAVRSELQKRAILATAFVAPVPGVNLRDLRRLGSLRDARTPLTLLEVADAETLAGRDRRYHVTTIPAGALRPNPPLPDEGTETLAVARLLMVREKVASLFVSRLTRDLLDAARSLQPQHPLLAQAGAPDLETGAFVPVHPGARAYLNGEERGLVESMLEWLYVLPLLFGALASLGMWLRRWLGPPQTGDVETLMREALALRRAAGAAQSMQELQALRRQFEQLTGQLESNLVKFGRADAGNILTAVDLCDRRIDARRLELDEVSRRTGRTG
ncbi:MAG: hypothetical protein LCH61_01535 [Proteobacteria bacterium]|nr:hypothetical protein [Pseudomonadota bacterium]